jgi:hypothetical protein
MTRIVKGFRSEAGQSPCRSILPTTERTAHLQLSAGGSVPAAELPTWR